MVTSGTKMEGGQLHILRTYIQGCNGNQRRDCRVGGVCVCDSPFPSSDDEEADAGYDHQNANRRDDQVNVHANVALKG